MELEAKVEKVVLEAIESRQGTSSPELPTWVKEGRGVVEVVWEGLGGCDSHVTGKSDRDAEATQASSPRLQEQFEAETSRKEEGASRESPEGVGQGGPGGEEGSFIWVERVALSEDWEELLMEGLEAPPGVGCEGGPEALMGTQQRGSGESWEMDKSEGSEERGVTTDEEKWAEKEKEDGEPLEVEKGGSKELLDGEPGSKGSLGEETKGSNELLDEKPEGEGSLDRESKTNEKLLEGEPRGEGTLDEETKGSKELLDGEPGSKGSLGEETKGSKMLLDRDPGDSELSSEVEKTPGTKEEVSPEERDKPNEGAEFLVEDASQSGIPLLVHEKPTPEGQGLQGLEKQEGPVEETAREPQPCAESEGPPEDATPLLAETPAPEQPVEGQPLLHQEVSSTNPGDHPAPTYAPARQLELAEAKEAGGPKQKTCQCCVVM
ncbi:Palm3 [Lemmus lemmus]